MQSLLVGILISNFIRDSQRTKKPLGSGSFYKQKIRCYEPFLCPCINIILEKIILPLSNGCQHPYISSLQKLGTWLPGSSILDSGVSVTTEITVGKPQISASENPRLLSQEIAVFSFSCQLLKFTKIIKRSKGAGR